MKPKNLAEDTLYPLNVLKDRYPEQYREHAAKYDWRLELMDIVIPKLNCLWNDVLMFTFVFRPEMNMD